MANGVFRALRIAPACLLILGLCGCSDAGWDQFSLFSEHHRQAPEVTPEAPETTSAVAPPPPAQDVTTMVEPAVTADGAPMPAPQAGAQAPEEIAPRGAMASAQAPGAFIPEPGNDFCHQAAASAAEESARNGFTPQTVQSHYRQQLSQCEALMAQ